MASRIYVVTDMGTRKIVRYVRANTLNGAIRAVARELFDAAPATTEQMWQASKAGAMDVLDALEEA